MPLRKRRIDTEDALGDRPIRKWQRCACKWGPFPWFQHNSYQIPRYLDDKTSDLAKLEQDDDGQTSDSTGPEPTSRLFCSTGERLQWFHEYLSFTRDDQQCLSRCVWVSTTDERTCIYSNQSTIAQNLDVFQQQLSAAKNRALSFLAVNINAGPDFEWYYRKVPTNTYFRDLVRVIVHNHWLDSDTKIAQIMRQIENRPASQLAWRSKLPSGVSQQDGVQCREPSVHDLDITLEWLHDHPKVDKFLGFRDWSIYISEPYTRRPVLDALRIADVTPYGSADHRMILATTSGDALEDLKRTHDAAMRTKVIDVTSGVEDQMFKSLMTSFKVVIRSVCRYITGSVKLAQDLDMASRTSPSLSKVQFLLHLQECHKWSAQACHENACKISAAFRSPMPVTEVTHEWQRACRIHVADFEYLASELENCALQIDELRERISSQIELYDKRRNRIVGMLIAVYVPLAFATSLFGMNLSNVSVSTDWTNTTSIELNMSANGTDPWHNYLRQDFEIEPQTPVFRTATLTTSSQPGSRTWPMRTFAIVAGILTFGSVIVPLVAGWIYRKTARFSISHKRHFRLIVSFFWLLYISIMPHYLGRIPMLFVASVGCVMACYYVTVHLRHSRFAETVMSIVWLLLNIAGITVLTHPNVDPDSRTLLYVGGGCVWVVALAIWSS